MGASPLRTSRVEYISSGNTSFDSVVFQQGKSLLDFDLNVLQDVLKSTIEQLARSVFSGSGFLASPTISITSNSGACNFSMEPATLNLFGKIVNISGPSGGTISLPNITTANNAMVWLEMWYQEIAPDGTQEKINDSSVVENKSSRIIQYGGIPNKSSDVIFNNLKDVNFGAETTRRVQFRWNIRADSVSSGEGFSANRLHTGTPVTTIFAKAGRTPDDTSSSSTYPTVPGITPSANFYFLSSSLYLATSGTTYLEMLKNSFEEFKNFDKNTPKIYIAGRGSSADASELNTVDGRVYAIPLGYLTKSSNVYSFEKATEATTETGISTQGTTSGASFSLVSNGETYGSFSTIKNAGDGKYIQVESGLSIPSGSASSPSLTFTSISGTEVAKNTGIFFSADSSSDKIGFSVLGSEKASLSASSSSASFSLASNVDLSVGGNVTVASGKYLRVNFPATGGPSLQSSQSYINSLYVSSLVAPMVDISGGSIVSKLSGTSGSGAVITGHINAKASIDLKVENDPVDQSIRQINFVAGQSAYITKSLDSTSTIATITIQGTTSFADTTSLASSADPDGTARTSPTSAPGQSWQEGSSVRAARRDHQHARESWVTAGSVIRQPSTSSTSTDIIGSLGSVPRGDHSHALPLYINPMAFSAGTSVTGISSATSAVEAYGAYSSSSSQVTIYDSTATPASGIGSKLTFGGKNNSGNYTSWASFFSSRDTTSSSSQTFLSFFVSSSVALSGNLKETIKLFAPSISYPASLTSVASASSSSQGALSSLYGMSSTYFAANSGSGTPATGTARFLGSISGAPSIPVGGYTSWTLSSGDFVIDTTGNLHIYNGTQWLTAGILTTANNGWTGVQSFGSDKSYAQLGGNSTIGANIGNPSNGSGYILTTNASGTSTKASNLYIGAPNVSSGGTGIITEVSTVEIGGAPVQNSTNVITSSAGLLIRRATTSVISGTGYGARIYIPSGASNLYGLAIESAALTNSTTNAYGIYINAPTGATNNYALYASGDSTITGTVKLTSTTSSTSTSTGAIIVSGGVGIAGAINIGGAAAIGGNLSATGTLSISSTSSFTGAVSVSSATDSSSSTTGAVIITGGLGVGKSIRSASTVYAASLQIDNNNYIYAKTADGLGAISLARVNDSNDIYYGDGGSANNVFMPIKIGQRFIISNNAYQFFTFGGGSLTIGQYSSIYTASDLGYVPSGTGYENTNLLEIQGGWRLGTNAPYNTQSSTNYYGGLGGSLNRSNNIYSLYFRDRSDTWWNKAYIEANDFSFRTNNFVDPSAIVNAGNFIIGMTYQINTLGTSTQAVWNTVAGTTNSTYNTGSIFIASTNGSTLAGGASAYELRRGPAQTKMQILNNGRVNINSSSSGGGFILDVNGTSRFFSSNNYSGSLSSITSGGSISMETAGSGVLWNLWSTDGTNWKYGIPSSYGWAIQEKSGSLVWSSAPQLAANGAHGDSATITERMKLTNSGKLGIGTFGTLAPSYGLHVQGTDSTAIMIERVANDTTTNNTYTRGMYIRSGSNTIDFGVAGIDYIDSYYKDKGWITSTGKLAFGAGSNAKPYHFVIAKDGSVGIGADDPNTKLEIRQWRSDETSNSTLSLLTTPQLLLKGFSGGGTYYSGVAFAMNEHSNGFWGSGLFSHDDTISYGSALTFYTSTGSSIPSPTEKMRISSSGNVGIGTSNPSTTLEINGALTIGNNSGIILNDSSDTLYTMASYTDIIHNQISGNDFFRIQTGTKSLGTSAIVNNNGYVEISTADDSSEPIWVSQYNVTSEYTAGTAYQSGNTITGIGTNWASSMVGNEFYYVGTYGKYRGGTITGVPSATSITVDTNQTVGSVSSPSNYKIGGPFGKRTRRAAILDESGNTYFPGKMYGGAAPRCFIPAASFTSTSATMSAEANTGQFQYSFSGGNTAFVFLVVPSNYSGAACSYTIHGTNPGNLSVVYGTTTNPATAFTSGTTTLSASTGYYFKLTCATGASAILTGMSMVFG